MKTSAILLAMMLAGSVCAAAKDQSKTPYVEPTDTSTVDTSGWTSLSGPTRLTWTPGNEHYRQFASPKVTMCTDTVINAWRGERIGIEAMLISP